MGLWIKPEDYCRKCTTISIAVLNVEKIMFVCYKDKSWKLIYKMEQIVQFIPSREQIVELLSNGEQIVHFISSREQIQKTYQETIDLFNHHPQAVGQTYGEHFYNAFSYGTNSCLSGVVFMVHSIFPFIFEDTGSNMIHELNEKLEKKRREIDIIMKEDEKVVDKEHMD